MRHVVVGTAGHIDHGKTSLVKALTGTDTDRLPEEKARGITIDLGFAFLEEPDGLVIEIVDVPGHERFVKNMLAGAGGIDLALLVVAADEGVMPQTREHLAICQLLRIRSGLVVLTKADLAEPDWIELVRDDVRRAVDGTFLADAPIVPVSAKTGAGVPEVRATLARLARAVPAKDPDRTARLPIDRVFTVRGFGTVVTGTLVAGRFAVDQRVEVYPRGIQSKIRGLQVHGHTVERAEAGQRTAVNLQSVERAAIERGDVVAPAGALVPTLLLDGTLELLAEAPRPVKTRDRVRFHAGTQEVMARVLPVGRAEVQPGSLAHARFRLEAPVVALPGDRFVVRSYSPIVTIGGGTVLDIAPPRFKRKGPALAEHLALLATGEPAQVLEEHLKQAGASGARVADLRARTPFGGEHLARLLAELGRAGRILAVDREWYLHRDASDRLRHQTLSVLEAFHRENPLRGGISREELRSRVGQAQERVFGQLLAALEGEGVVQSDRDQVRLATHTIRLSPAQDRVVKGLEADFRDAGAAPPSPEEALGRYGVKGTEKNELFQILVADRTLVRVKESLFFHAEALRSVQAQLVALLRKKKEIGPADFKDLFGVSRKYAIPLMEYFDAQRVTMRVGERRVLREGPGREEPDPGA
ncbi:MAG TPA: selenocysteine-specific translation elongation factor [Methylomirabilota bacterium]